MINSVKKIDCCGCSACLNICPNSSIDMIADNEGFLYPQITSGTCIECNLCESVCPSLNNIGTFKKNYLEPKVYAGWSLNEETRFSSTSGGVFTEIAEYIIGLGGYVYGARYTKNHLVEHFEISNSNDIGILRQSKYIQSEKGYIYKTVKSRLNTGFLVVFVGSPCEVVALKNYLNVIYDNLITIDFVCRGANSPLAYTEYLTYLEKKYNSSITRVWFKNKTYTWNKFSTRIDFQNGKIYLKDRYNDLFMQGYIEHNLYMRPSCSKCNFKSIPRYSDITLADYWGAKEKFNEINDDLGVSLLFTNSHAGINILSNIKDKLFLKESTLEHAIKNNPCVLHSAKYNPNRNILFEYLKFTSFDISVKKAMRLNIVNTIKRDIYRPLKSIVLNRHLK